MENSLPWEGTRDTEKTSSNARVAEMNKKNLHSVNIDANASNHWSKPVRPVKKVKSCTGLQLINRTFSNTDVL